jgi:hypothetical protein
VTFDEMESALRARLQTLPPAARAELLHVFMLPDFDRVERRGRRGQGGASGRVRAAGRDERR